MQLEQGRQGLWLWGAGLPLLPSCCLCRRPGGLLSAEPPPRQGAPGQEVPAGNGKCQGGGAEADPCAQRRA